MKPNYSFTVHRKVEADPLRITLSKSQMHLTQEIIDLMGNPERVLVHYDQENKAIKLEISEDAYARKIKVQKNRYYSISTTLAKLMPTGRYVLKDSADFIFVMGSA